jgi:hypothetical protein
MAEITGLMSPETEKELADKLKFRNKILEIVDDPLVRIFDNKLLQPLKQKLPVEYHAVIIGALKEVVHEMEPIEI